MKTSARYQSLILAGHSHEHASELATSWRSWPLLSRILTDARIDNGTPIKPGPASSSAHQPSTLNPQLLPHPMKTSTPLPAHIARHHAAQDAGQFTPWFKAPKNTVKIYGITLLIDDHLIESCEVSATTAAKAIERALDIRLAQAIRERRPNLSIKPWGITGTRLAA